MLPPTRPRSAPALARVLALLVVLLPSCASLRHDAAQAVHLGLGVSTVPGFDVHVLAPLLAVPVGWMDEGYYVGSDYGYTHAWEQAAWGTVIGGELARAEWSAGLEGWDSRGVAPGAYLVQGQLVLMNGIVTDHRWGRPRGQLSLTRAELAVHVLFVGLSVGLDVAELLDALAGLVGWDPLDDDGLRPDRAPFDDADPRAVP